MDLRKLIANLFEKDKDNSDLEMEERRKGNIQLEEKISSLLSKEELSEYRKEVVYSFGDRDKYEELGLKYSHPDVLLLKEKLLEKYVQNKLKSYSSWV